MPVLSLNVSELLFYGGIVIMAAVVMIAIAACAILSITGRRLRARLEREYGKKRR